MKYFSNLKRYDERGRRVAIYGQLIDSQPDKMNVTIIRCSKKDQFSKKTANSFYNTSRGMKGMEIDGLVPHPEEYQIKIENVATPKKCFLEWCKKHFYVIFTTEVPIKGRLLEKTHPSRVRGKSIFKMLEIKTLAKI